MTNRRVTLGMVVVAFYALGLSARIGYSQEKAAPTGVNQLIPARGDNAALQLFILIDDTCDNNIGNNLNDIRDFVNAQPATTVVGIAYMSNATWKRRLVNPASPRSRTKPAENTSRWELRICSASSPILIAYREFSTTNTTSSLRRCRRGRPAYSV